MVGCVMFFFIVRNLKIKFLVDCTHFLNCIGALKNKYNHVNIVAQRVTKKCFLMNTIRQTKFFDEHIICISYDNLGTLQNYRLVNFAAQANSVTWLHFQLRLVRWRLKQMRPFAASLLSAVNLSACYQRTK